MRYQQHTATGVNIMKTIGDLFNEASDHAMSLDCAFGSDDWDYNVCIYLSGHGL